jgi:hypothetical protein
MRIKAQLNRVARTMAEWPVIGRVVKICLTIFRLPEIKDACIALNHRQHVLETEQIPALRETLSALHYRQHVIETEQIPALQVAISALGQRQHVHENEQMPALRETIVALNHRQHVLETQQIPELQEFFSARNYRQTSTDSDRDNLVKSVPVALRKITRELADIRSRLENTTNSNGRHNGKD